jgi:glycine betaine/proline transport system substrate-binding protein
MFSARHTRRTATLAAGAVLALSLAGCASEDGIGGSSGGDGGSNGSASTDKTITLALPPAGWDEGTAASYLWKKFLTDKGYDVKTQSADLGVIFTGLAGGSYDLYADTWLPKTHAAYVKKYGSQIEDLGSWYDNAKLTIAVNNDSPAKSIDDLKKDASDYGNKLVGIEAGAGETGVVQNDMIPGYGLKGMNFVISSTPAMLASLKSATQTGKNIAVTLWRPHWAYNAYPIRDLEDPKGLMGAAEHIHVYAHKGFSSDHPDIAKWMKNFKLTDKQIGELENLMENTPQYKNDPEGAVNAWLKKNPSFESSVVGGSDAGSTATAATSGS